MSVCLNVCVRFLRTNGKTKVSNRVPVDRVVTNVEVLDRSVGWSGKLNRCEKFEGGRAKH